MRLIQKFDPHCWEKTVNCKHCTSKLGIGLDDLFIDGDLQADICFINIAYQCCVCGKINHIYNNDIPSPIYDIIMEKCHYG